MRRPAPARQSLGRTYGHPFGAYTPSLADVRVWALARSPLHYEPGDMRGDYDWLRAMLVGALTAGLIALGVRLVVTAAVVALVAADLWLIAACNLGLKGVVLATVAGRRIRAGTVPTPAFLRCICRWVRKREAERL